MRKLLVLAGLAGAAAVVVKKLQSQQAQPVWHTPDTDPEPTLSVVPDPAPAAATEPADDAGGAGLDEALADSVEEPHVATTPDAPLTETQIPQD
jgi:hypothetical protein